MLHIQVVGLGCPRCAKLARRAEMAAQRLGKPYRLEKVRDLQRIVQIGVRVPALVIDGAVCAAGIVPSVAAIQKMLSGAASGAVATPTPGDSPAR